MKNYQAYNFNNANKGQNGSSFLLSKVVKNFVLSFVLIILSSLGIVGGLALSFNSSSSLKIDDVKAFAGNTMYFQKMLGVDSVSIDSNNNGTLDLSLDKYTFTGEYYQEENETAGGYDNIYRDAKLTATASSGYSIVGWYTSENATEDTLVQSGPTITVSGDCKINGIDYTGQTLYVYSKANIYTITLDADGGTIPSTTDWSVSTGNDSIATKTLSVADTLGELPIPTKIGYKFHGWYTSGPKATQVSSTTVVGNITETTRLHASWSKCVKLTFFGNGGQFIYQYDEDSEPESSLTFEQTTSYELTQLHGSYNHYSDSFYLDDPYYAIRLNYTFGGFSSYTSGTTDAFSTINVNDLVNNYDVVSFYAIWIPVTYTISYDLNGGTVSPQNPTSYTVEDTFTLNNPTKEGYTFLGWTGTGLSSPTTTISIVDGYANGMVGYNRTYTANWKATSYSISYNLDGGEVETENPASYTLETEDFTLNNPTKTGYRFLGWTGSNGTTPQKTITITKGSMGDKSYTATWEKVINLTFESNGGTFIELDGEQEIERTTLTFSNVTKRYAKQLRDEYSYSSNQLYLDDQFGASRDYYTFGGLSDSKTGKIDRFGQTEFDEVIDYYDSYTFYAIWIPVTYTISYNLNGGTVSPENPTSYTIEDTFTLNNPTKTGYTFAGWTGTGLSSPTTTISIVNGYANGMVGYNRTYTANWELANVDFPSNWKTEVYSSTGIESDAIDSIKFEKTVPSGYSLAGTLSTGIFVYKSDANIAFVWPKSIYATTDANSLFSELSNVTSITFNNFNTSNTTAMFQMFYKCSSLTNLNVSTFDIAKVMSISGMFNGCSSLVSLDLSNFDYSSIANATNSRAGYSCLFYNCTSLKNITFGDKFCTDKGSSISTTMYNMFYNCTSLTSLDLSMFNTANVTNMNGMFNNCSNLKEINFGNTFDTSKVTSMGYMFNGCSTLTNLDLSSFDMSKVTTATNMLTNCTALTELKTPKNVSVSVTLPKTMYDYNDYSIRTTLPTGLSVSHTLRTTAPIFNITINNNNGSGGAASPSSYNLGRLTASTLTSPTRTGFTFNGWSVEWTDSTHSSASPTLSGTSLIITTNCYGNITLTATWTANTYTNTLNYDANGGSNAPSAQTEEVSYPNTQSTFTIVGDEPTLEGYTFAGWYTQANGGVKVGSTYTVGSNNAVENQSATLYAHWTPVEYTITYDYAGGTANNVTTYNIETETFTLNAPTKENATFIGYTGSNGTTPQTVVTITKGSTGDKNYIANWILSQVKPTAITGLVYSGLEQVGVENNTNIGFDLISGQDKATNAGNYSATFKLKDGYVWEDGTTEDLVINFTISKKDLSIKAENKNIIFGENAPTYTFSANGFVNNETEENLTGSIVYEIKNSNNETVVITTTSNVGTYTIIPSGFSSNNYEITYENGTLIISNTRAVINLSKETESVAYGDTTTFTINYNGDGEVSVTSGNSEVVEVSKLGNEVTVKVIAYSETPVEVVVSSTAGQNYGEAESKTFTLTTLKRQLEVTSLGDTKAYNGTELTKHQANITNGSLANFNGVADFATFDFEGTITDFGEVSNMFTAKITRNDVDITTYYEIAYVYGKLSITKAELLQPTNLAVDSYGKVTFDSVVGATGYEISVNNSSFTTCNSGNNYNDLITAVAGEREIKVRAVSTNANYELTSTAISTNVMVYTLTLNKKVNENTTKVYSKNYISGRTIDISIEIGKDDKFIEWIVEGNGDEPLDSNSNNTSLTITKDTVITAKVEVTSNNSVGVIILISSMAGLAIIIALVTLIVIRNKKNKKRAKINRIIINK